MGHWSRTYLCFKQSVGGICKEPEYGRVGKNIHYLRSEKVLFYIRALVYLRFPKKQEEAIKNPLQKKIF